MEVGPFPLYFVRASYDDEDFGFLYYVGEDHNVYGAQGHIRYFETKEEAEAATVLAFAKNPWFTFEVCKMRVNKGPVVVS